MTRLRDRVIALAVILLVAALASAVVVLVLDAQRSGIDTRRDFRLEQIRGEASRMDALVQQAVDSLVARYGAPGVLNLTPDDPADAGLIAPQSPDASAGTVLVDADGTIVNGSLLRDPDAVGTTLDRPGLQRALGGEPAVLPVAEGATTSRPTVAVAIPARDDAGRLAGAVITEVEVAPGSPFNELLSQPRTGETGGFAFVDENGVAVAATDDALLGKPLEDEVVEGLEPGWHRAGGKVAAIADVPTPRWKAVFEQDVDEFEGDLTGPLQTALLLFLGAVGIVAVFTVVALTRRLAAERDEQRRLRELGEAREEFTSIVSHELRTPVTGLLGFLQTTIDHWETMGDDDRRRAVTRAFANARSLQTLTSDVLDSAGIEAQTLSYRFDTVDLRECIADAVESVRDGAPDRPIRYEPPEGPIVVRADTLRVRQVLSNLLDNALKSSAPDAPIDVSAHVVDGAAEVSVRDRGPGIAPDERERIFEKFTRGRGGMVRGSGLGLYISRHIVEAHGGTIGAESVAGEPGTRLSFRIPLAASSASLRGE